MGQKVHPAGFRLVVNKAWLGRWYAGKNYTDLLHEDLKIRRTIMERLREASIPRIEIERGANQVAVTINTAKPGIVIGKAGVKVDELKNLLEKLTAKKVRVNIQEIRIPELDAQLVARNIAEQIERRVAYKRAMKQSVQRSMQRGAKGVKVIVSGRLGGAEMSRRETERSGQVPLQTLRANIDYGFTEARTTFGRIGIKVWIYKGDVLPEPKRAPAPARIQEVAT